LTQKKLAENVGMSRQAIVALEREGGRPQAPNVMLSPADQVERWTRELREAREADDKTLCGALARVARAESQLRFWEALVGLGQRRVSGERVSDEMASSGLAAQPRISGVMTRLARRTRRASNGMRASAWTAAR
jgi:transcriptional regulator with XRE-family HTH domain